MSGKGESRFLWGVVALYWVSWLLFMGQLKIDIWLGLAIPVTVTYCGLMARTMFLHGKIWLSADIPGFPAAILVMILLVALAVTAGWLEWGLELLLSALARFGSAWLGSHLVVMLFFLVAEKMGWDKGK